MSSSRERLKRKQPFRSERKLIVISSEGRETEPRYFTKINKNKNIRIQIVTDRFGTDPISVLNAAKKFKKNNEVRKNDEIWVVVDTDFSPDLKDMKEIQLAEAGNQCQELGFGFAVSNPCFEFWLLLHFENRPRIRSTIRVQDTCMRLLKKHYPGYDKSSYDVGKFAEKVHTAIENAKNLDNTLQKSWPRNHGSTVYKLMEVILNNDSQS